MKIKIIVESDHGKKTEITGIDANTFRKVLDHGFKSLKGFLAEKSGSEYVANPEDYAERLEKLLKEEERYSDIVGKICTWLMKTGDL